MKINLSLIADMININEGFCMTTKYIKHTFSLKLSFSHKVNVVKVHQGSCDGSDLAQLLSVSR